MCFRVDCKQCGKYSWGGCGEHLATLYAKIDQGKHCMCRPWPGVVLPQPQPQPPHNANATHQQLPTSSGSSASGQVSSKQAN